MRIATLSADEVSLIAQIDRAEHVDIEYCVVDGKLTERPPTITEVPNWDQDGSGPHSVADKITFCATVIAEGGTFLGAFDDDSVAGLAIVDPTFDAGLAWLAFLHVSRPFRRRGAARSLWNEAIGCARADGAHSIYVSATPTGSAVGFYLAQGCQLADPVHSKLFALEPDDIHLVCRVR